MKKTKGKEYRGLPCKTESGFTLYFAGVGTWHVVKFNQLVSVFQESRHLDYALQRFAELISTL